MVCTDRRNSPRSRCTPERRESPARRAGRTRSRLHSPAVCAAGQRVVHRGPRATPATARDALRRGRRSRCPRGRRDAADRPRPARRRRRPDRRARRRGSSGSAGIAPRIARRAGQLGAAVEQLLEARVGDQPGGRPGAAAPAIHLEVDVARLGREAAALDEAAAPPSTRRVSRSAAGAGPRIATLRRSESSRWRP